MKYIRTKDEIYEFRELVGFETYLCAKRYNEYSSSLYQIEQKDIIKQADTIEELMMIDDLVFKKNGDIFVIANQAYIDYYIKYKSVSKLFIKDSKGNYIKVAEENEKGELELL